MSYHLGVNYRHLPAACAPFHQTDLIRTGDEELAIDGFDQNLPIAKHIGEAFHDIITGAVARADNLAN